MYSLKEHFGIYDDIYPQSPKCLDVNENSYQCDNIPWWYSWWVNTTPVSWWGNDKYRRLTPYMNRRYTRPVYNPAPFSSRGTAVYRGHTGGHR